MKEFFGSRWTDQHGEFPSPLWTQAIASLTPTEEKRVLRSLLTSGAAHPPALPELIEFARPGTAQKGAESKHPPVFSPDWNGARNTVLEKIAQQTRDRGVQFSDAQRVQSKRALDLASLAPGQVGYAEAKKAYEATARR